MPLQTIRFENAVVYLGQDRPLLDRLTIRGDEILSNDTPADRIVDCAGGAVLPAFVDAHCHPLAAARASLGPDVSECTDIEQIRAVLSQWQLSHPDASWVVGGFYDRSIASDGHFEAAWLDDLGSTPILLHANDQHSIWVNSAALEQASLATGAGTGTLREDDKTPLLDLLPKPTPEKVARAVEHQLSKLAALGIVSVTDAWVDEQGADVYRLVESPVRVKQVRWVTPESALAGLPGEGAIKIFLDGVLGSSTAMVSKPFEHFDKHPHGISSWNYNDFAQVLRQTAEMHLEVLVHAIGDTAIDWIIRAATPGANIRIEHAETLRSDQIIALSKLGIGICFQPLWARPDEMYRAALRNLGEERAANLYPIGSAMQASVPVVFGSDWPVSSADPLLGIFTAVHRREPSGSLVHNNAEAIDLCTAIDCYSSKRTGDYVLLDGNPFVDSGRNLWELNVVETFSGGRTIYARH